MDQTQKNRHYISLTAKKYAQSLYELDVPEEDIREAGRIIRTTEELEKTLSNKVVSFREKSRVIDKTFPQSMGDVLKKMCQDEQMESLADVFMAYEDLMDRQKGVQKAVLACVEAPDAAQLQKLEQFICRKYHARSARIEIRKDDSLLGGFVLTVDCDEYDWSTKGRLKRMEKSLASTKARQLGSDEIISILKEEIENFDSYSKESEVGTVVSVGDGIAVIHGIDHAMYGEIVVFDTGLKGMVQDIRKDEVGCILFGSDAQIREGTKVSRSGKRAGIPVGDQFIGRVVNALGAPIDEKGAIKEDDYRPVEMEAPGIVDRKSVDTPMETGILAIDSMFPIGRGQRELIIGDRQTGKTSIALDTILNQKGKDVICIYVAIGQKASSVAKVVNTLNNHGAMDYTIVVSSTASDCAPLQYIAPYAGTALAEYFMYKGKDVLIVYDDLSKHAVAYRALSLLLGRSPGREAYPGDVFYLHSRLLERSSHLCEALGGGSITALPIIETQAGDVSAYIPTNVISITDGQIFLESGLFASGMRPAVNVGLSVSRVGGAAQTKAMKKASGSIRIDLAQYREMEVFTQFSSDLDPATKEELDYGSGLMELLKQPLCHPLSLHEKVITLCAATHKVFLGVDKKQVKAFQTEMLEYFDRVHPGIGRQIEETKELTDDQIQAIIVTAVEFKKSRC